jgi:N-acyl-D-aspartate/D-glutamate deacylase
VTAEAYPYGAGCTAVGAAFLAPEALAQQGLRPEDIRYLPTGERVASLARLAELRASDPGGLVVVDFLHEDDPGDLGFLTRALLADDTAIASDAMPLVPPPGSAPGPSDRSWPVAPGTLTHPRTAGTFSRVLRWYVRELGILDLPEAIRRATLVPAEILRDVAPQMRRKGRVQVDSDADLVVLDPDVVSDQATYAEPTRTAAGISHVMVGGELVVRDGELRPLLRPGRPVLGRSG